LKKFIMIAIGFKPPTPEIMTAWRQWFASIGDKVVDPGNPLGPGQEVTSDGVTALPFDMQAITGYTIINAEDMDAAVQIAKGCPVVASMRVYEAMPMG
jgi:hypothetical protein